MRGAALSDLHLGFRAYAATIDGRNAREVDVERAWAAAVDKIVADGPDLVTIAGDVVHHPRVGSHAIKAWREGVRRIVSETDAHLVVIQGNHDAGRSVEVLSPIVIPDDLPRVHVVLEPKRLRLHVERTGERVSVACFPFVALGTERVYTLDPDPDADVNVLLVHAPVKTSADDADTIPYFYAGDQALDVGREAERWDVVAAGDFHEFRRLHPARLAFYSGSIERTSSNIWDETEPKRIVFYDTEDGRNLLDPVAVATRDMVVADLGDFDLPPGVGAADLNACLQRLVDCPGTMRTEGSIFRFLVDAFPRAERDSIDWALVRTLKQRCLHFQLDLRFAELAPAGVRDRREQGGRTLTEEAAAFFVDSPEDVRALALSYLGGES